MSYHLCPLGILAEGFNIPGKFATYRSVLSFKALREKKSVLEKKFDQLKRELAAKTHSLDKAKMEKQVTFQKQMVFKDQGRSEEILLIFLKLKRLV